MAINTLYLQTFLPPQKVSFSEKDKDWQKDSVDAIISMGTQIMYNGRDSQYRKQINYDLVNGIFDEADFDYVLNPYSLPGKLGGNPAQLQNFNIIRAKLELLKGEEIKRPFNRTVVATGGAAVSIFEEKKKAAILKALQQSVQDQLAKDGLAEPPTDEQGNPVQPQAPEQVAKWFNATYSDIRERLANQILDYGEKKDRFQAKFNRGWEHALTSAEEIYYVGIISNEPTLRVVNPLNFDYDKSPDLENIEDAQWAREVRYLSVGQILDEYAEFLSEDDVARLDKGILGVNTFATNRQMMYPGYAYNPKDLTNYNVNRQSQTSHIPVVTCVWKSMRKIGFVTYLVDGKPETTIVSDDFKLTPELKEQGYSVKWEWVNEIWKGTRIADDIYVDIAPLPNQAKSLDNPSLCKLPYIGRIYNNLNSQATSLVDLCKPHQYTYITVWYRLMTELAKAKGKKMVFDFAAIPRSQGMNVDQWMYYFDNLGIAFINSFEEGEDGRHAGKTATSQFNQYTAIDMSLSQVVQQYMMILEKLEDMVGELCGVSRQRQGQISSNETVGGVERSVVQSSMVTESLFFYHNEVKKQVLTQYIEVAKIAYRKGKKTQFIADDMMRVFLDVDGEMFADSEYGVFVSNATKDNQIIEKLNQLAQVALQTDKARLSDIIKIYKSNSISEIEDTIKTGEQEAIGRQQQQADQANQAQIQTAQMQNDNAEKQRQWQANENELDRESKVQIAEISAMGFEKDQDMDKDGVPDVLEIEKLKQKTTSDLLKANVQEKKIQSDSSEAEKQRMHEKEMQNKEIKIKEKEIEAKKVIARNKPKSKK